MANVPCDSNFSGLNFLLSLMIPVHTHAAKLRACALATYDFVDARFATLTALDGAHLLTLLKCLFEHKAVFGNEVWERKADGLVRHVAVTSRKFVDQAHGVRVL